jgi:hypothetical protein
MERGHFLSQLLPWKTEIKRTSTWMRQVNKWLKESNIRRAKAGGNNPL